MTARTLPLAATFLLALLITACATTSGTQVSDEDLGQIKKGQTNYSEVVDKLGEPDAEKTTNEGRVIVYNYSEARPGLLSYVPYASALSKTDTKYRVIYIFFDSNDIVHEVQVEKGGSESGSSL